MSKLPDYLCLHYTAGIDITTVYNIEMQTLDILNSLQLNVVEVLKGKTKAVYLVEHRGTKYIAKIASNEEQKQLILKEIKILESIPDAAELFPTLVDVRTLDNNVILIQEYLTGQTLYEFEHPQELHNIYQALGNKLKLLHSNKRETPGEIINNKHTTWIAYLQDRIDNYCNNLTDEIKNLRIIQELKEGVAALKEPEQYSLLHMDLQGGNILVDSKLDVKFIDLDEAIYGDKDYELARILKAHFYDESSAKSKESFLTMLDSTAYVSSQKAKVYAGLRTLHYIEILCKENNKAEIENQLENFYALQ